MIFIRTGVQVLHRRDLIVTSFAIDKKLEKINSKFTKISKLNSKFTKISKLNSKLTKNLENRLEIYSYFKLENKLEISEFLSMVDEINIKPTVWIGEELITELNTCNIDTLT